LRLYEKRPHGYRKLDISSNTNGEERLAIRLTPKVIEFRKSEEKPPREVKGRETIEIAKKILLEPAVQEELTSWAGAGRALAMMEYSKNESAGRSMAIRMREQRLLKLENGRIVRGDSLLSLPS
jgi:hypothetical protein